jgi:hypothetical protein
MSILAAIRREEKRVKKQLAKLQGELEACNPRQKHWASRQTGTWLVPRSV